MRGQHIDLSLADLNWLSDEENLKAQADELLREHDRTAKTFRGGEPSGSVWVTVDRAVKVVDVVIKGNWPDQLAAERFPGAVFEAYTTAARTAMLVRSSTSDEPRRTPVETIPAELDDEEWLRRVRASLDRTEAELAAIRHASAVAPPGEEKLTGRNGYLTLVVRDGGPVAITADPAALAYADTARLRLDALDVFARAGLGEVAEEDEDTDGDFGFEY